jgi:serine/alanine adding enzyme
LRKSQLTEVEAARWDPLLDDLGCADSYLTRSYLEASCGLAGPGEPTLLHLEARGGHVVFACIVRESPTDVTTPYGYGGPVAAGPRPPIEEFSQCYEEWAHQRGVVSTFIVFHPRFGNDRYGPQQFLMEPLAGTVTWRLDTSDGLLENMRPDHRRTVRRAQRAGLDVAIHDESVRLADFVPLYETTMQRNDAAPFYFFPKEYWLALESGVPILRWDARTDGNLVASLLCLSSHPWLYTHLSAASGVGRQLGASHLLRYAAAQWARDRNYTHFHLGGGVGGRQDALLEFKRRFYPAGITKTFTGKAIHNQLRYRELSGTRAPTGHFPAYRRP